METTLEKMPAYTVEQLQDIAVREASKMMDSLARYETRYHLIAEYLEDMAGAFMVGALKATASLDPEKAGNRSYQWKSGHGEMLDRLNEIKAELSDNTPSIYASVEGGEEDEDGGNLLDTVADEKSENPAEAFGLKLNCEALREAMALLTEEQKEIIVARYADGNTTEKTAELLGKCAARVCRREAEALAILRRELAA